MKWWAGVLNILAGSLIVYLIAIAHNQIEVHERDFQSEVLAQAIDTANGYAFRNSLNYSNLDQDYDDLQTMTLDPTNVLRDFEIMMCICYGMSLSQENLDLVGSCIDGGVLCDTDGYYKLQIIEKPVLFDDIAPNEDYKYESTTEGKKKVGNRVYVENDTSTFAASLKQNPAGGTTFDKVKTGNVAYELGWTTKLPYTVVGKEAGLLGTYAVSLTNATTYKYAYTGGKGKVTRNRVNEPNRHVEERQYVHHGTVIKYQKIIADYDNYYNFMAMKKNYNSDGTFTYVDDRKMSDELKYQRLNNILASALNSSIKNILEARGIQMNYTVYLPSSTTQSGVNPVKSNTLLISMSKASFAGKYAYLSEPILAGHRAVSKEYIVEYVDNDGVRRYCYASQLPADLYPLDTRLEMYYSEYDAMMAGCKPSVEYITRPLLRELQLAD